MEAYIKPSFPENAAAANIIGLRRQAELKTPKKAVYHAWSDSERALMVNKYLKLVHNISLELRHKDWCAHLGYYVKRLNDPILSDIWSKEFASDVLSNVTLKNKVVSSIKLDEVKASFYTITRAPRRRDLITRYREQKV